SEGWGDARGDRRRRRKINELRAKMPNRRHAAPNRPEPLGMHPKQGLKTGAPITDRSMDQCRSTKQMRRSTNVQNVRNEALVKNRRFERWILYFVSDF